MPDRKFGRFIPMLALVFLATLKADAGTAESSVKGEGSFTAEQWQEMTDRLGQAWERMLAVYYSPKTHLFYAAPVDSVAPAAIFDNGFLDPDKKKVGYGHGMADCTIYGGIALSMLADQYEVTRDEALSAHARNVFKGLKLCATVHGVPGFVARGVCVENGRSICITSSRDQYTHFVHGLWRYYHSPLSGEDSIKAEILASWG